MSFPQTSGTPTLPHSVEAEQSVLGAILLDNHAFLDAQGRIEAEDFYVGSHRTIFKALTKALNRGEAADPVSLMEYLEKRDELESVGGSSYLAALVSTVPTARHIQAYVKLVREKSILRNLYRSAVGIAETAFQTPADLSDILDQAERDILDVRKMHGAAGVNQAEAKEIIGPVFERLDALIEGGVAGIPTGFDDLDELLTGLHDSDLLILAGRPAMGKTSLAMNIAANVAIQGKTPVGVFSLEMSKEQIVGRMLASEARVNSHAMRSGELKAGDYPKLVTAANSLSSEASSLVIDETGGLTLSALRSKARRMVWEHGVRLIVIDYIQLMRGERKQQENRNQEISEITQGLKALAKELGLPIIALSQLSRKVEERDNKRPRLSDLRDSGSIEQDADAVMFVFREEYYNKVDPNLIGKAEVIVAKHRNGPVGDVTLRFHHSYTRFDNYES